MEVRTTEPDELRAVYETSHTPSPMSFLTTLLRCPKHERPFVLLPVGYPADDCVVPDLRRKSLDEVASFVE